MNADLINRAVDAVTEEAAGHLSTGSYDGERIAKALGVTVNKLYSLLRQSGRFSVRAKYYNGRRIGSFYRIAK